MNVSARTQYACTAVLELALRYGSGRPVQVKKIAASQSIPPQFLTHILLQLKTAGLVASIRGAAGGYRLAKTPGEVSLGEVVALMEGSATRPEDGKAASPIARVLHAKWLEIDAAQQRILAATTFEDLVFEAQQSAAPMYFI